MDGSEYVSRLSADGGSFRTYPEGGKDLIEIQSMEGTLAGSDPPIHNTHNTHSAAALTIPRASAGNHIPMICRSLWIWPDTLG